MGYAVTTENKENQWGTHYAVSVKQVSDTNGGDGRQYFQFQHSINQQTAPKARKLGRQ